MRKAGCHRANLLIFLDVTLRTPKFLYLDVSPETAESITANQDGSLCVITAASATGATYPEAVERLKRHLDGNNFYSNWVFKWLEP